MDSNESPVISVIAHDLKDPMNAILSISDVLLGSWDELDNDEKRQLITDILSTSQKTFTLLEDLLVWSKVIASNFKTFRKNFSIRDIIEENLELINISAASKGIRITNCVKDDIFVNADKNMISTVFRNLISNAVRYIDAGCEVEINANSGNGFCRICISDNGHGIEAPHIKEFFNGEVNSEGIQITDYRKGLGLVMCKDFVNRNGGRIWFESEKNKGTNFFFTVPLSTLTLPLE